MTYSSRHPRNPLDLIIGIAGQPMGLLVDDVPTFEALGGEIREGVHIWAVVDGRAYPLICGDIVERYNAEDGERYTDRCGARANDGACEGHAAARDSWLSMSEAERCHVERQEEAWA